jgi:membrane protein DedA with SNARE-associated domain
MRDLPAGPIMTHFHELLIDYGLGILFGIVFLEQIGLPFPAPLLMLAAGALAAAHEFNLLGSLIVTLIACLLADVIWFYLGRHRGNHVLGFLCRISLEPDS